jgi:hypothetical protein
MEGRMYSAGMASTSGRRISATTTVTKKMVERCHKRRVVVSTIRASSSSSSSSPFSSVGDDEGSRRLRDPFNSSAGRTSSSSSSSRDPFGTTTMRTTTKDPFAAQSADGSKRRSKATESMTVSTASLATMEYRAWDDVEVYEVPERLRRPESERNVEFVEYKSLEELFPGSGLADAFHADAEFRTDIRRAMRDDLFVPDESLSEERNAAMRSLSSSVHVNWFESRTGYAALSECFARRGVSLDGETFIKTLGGLCREPCHGTLIDIASIGKQKIRHSWHQDSGYERFTVMMGFPSSVPNEDVGLPPGVGVFTHAVKLSHALVQPNAEGSVIQWENYHPYEGDFDAKYIARPEFRRNQEVMVYCDAHHVHSAPDVSNREAVWRFM